MSVQRGCILVIWKQLKLSGALIHLVSRANLKRTSQAQTEHFWMCSETSVNHNERSPLHPEVLLILSCLAWAVTPPIPSQHLCPTGPRLDIINTSL